jgi:hypothetical protein
VRVVMPISSSRWVLVFGGNGLLLAFQLFYRGLLLYRDALLKAPSI